MKDIVEGNMGPSSFSWRQSLMHGEMKDSQLDKVTSKKMVRAARCLLVAIAEKATFERKLPKRPVVPVTLTISMHWSVIPQFSKCNTTESMQACVVEVNINEQ